MLTRSFDRLLLGSVTEKVLRKAPCPILTVPPHAPPDAPQEVLFKRILCAMDFSQSALQAFGFAVDLARQANGFVTVLHTIEWLAEEEPRAHAHFNVAEFRQHLVADAQERLNALIGEEPRAGRSCGDRSTVSRSSPGGRGEDGGSDYHGRAGARRYGAGTVWIDHASGGACRNLPRADRPRVTAVAVGRTAGHSLILEPDSQLYPAGVLRAW
jgi:nucleotide-binding universal stress UspA family protein